MCEIITNNNEKLIGHIRNKFRGRHKRHNLISSGSIVLIGLREWEKPIKNCDILTIYEDSHIKQLTNMPNNFLLDFSFNSTGLYVIILSTISILGIIVFSVLVSCDSSGSTLISEDDIFLFVVLLLFLKVFVILLKADSKCLYGNVELLPPYIICSLDKV